MENEEKLFLARIEDLFSLCDKYGSARFSGFMDQSQKALIEDHVTGVYGYQVMFYGGYENCERCMYGVFPEWTLCQKEAFPIDILKISYRYQKTLTHRDYLGSVMSAGIERSKVGDILVGSQCAYIMLDRDIAEYVANHIHKIGQVGVTTQLVQEIGNEIPEQRFSYRDVTCASLRLDSVLSGALHISRQMAQKLILGEKVKKNHRLAASVSGAVQTGDLFSVSGYGRFYLSEIGGETRKGRLHIQIKEYE